MSYVKQNRKPTNRTKGASSGFDMVGGIPFPEDRSVQRFEGDTPDPDDFMNQYFGFSPSAGTLVKTWSDALTQMGGVPNTNASNPNLIAFANNQDKLKSATMGQATTLNPPSAATSAATSKSPFSNFPTSVAEAGTEVGKIIDKIFQTLGLNPPTKIIGAPGQKRGTVVFGPSGGGQVINTGTTRAGTQTGVTTGVPALDAIIDKILGRVVAGEMPSIGGVTEKVIEEAAREVLNLPPDIDMGSVRDTVGKIGKSVLNPAKVAPDGMEPTATAGEAAIGIDFSNTSGESTDNKVTDPAAGTGAATGTATGTDIAAAATAAIAPEQPAPLKGMPSTLAETPLSLRGMPSTLVEEEEERVVRGIVDPYDERTLFSDVPAPAESEEEVKATLPGGGSSPGGGGSPGGFGTPSEQGQRVTSGGPGDLVDINYFYDILGGLEQPFQTTEEEEDAVQYVYAKSGGMIQNNDLQQLLRLLKGR